MEDTLKQIREAEWNRFLAGLSPWEIHWIRPHELSLHDRFIDGEIDLVAVEAALTQAFASV